MNILLQPTPILICVLVIVLAVVNTLWNVHNNGGKLRPIDSVNILAFVVIIILLFAVKSNTVTNSEEEAVESSTVSDTEDTSLSEEELESHLTHALDLSIEDAVIKVGNSELHVLDNFDAFVGMADNQEYSITARQNLTASISTPGTPYEFYMFEETEEGEMKYYIYSYVENMSKQSVDIPLGYAKITELLVNFDVLDSVTFAGFDSEATYKSVVSKWGKEEYIYGEEYCWSTEWGHIFLQFNEDGTIHTIDLYIHAAYHDKAVVEYSEDTLKDFELEVAEEKEAYEKRQKEAEEAAKNVSANDDSDVDE